MTVIPICESMDPSLDRIGSIGVFADWKLPSDEEIRFIAEEAEFQTVIIGIAKSDHNGWSPKIQSQRIVERAIACRDAGLETIIMPWLVRRHDAIEGVCDWICNYFTASDPIVFDAEEGCYSGSVTPEAMADRIADRLVGRVWGVTGIGNLHGDLRPLVERARLICPQCYPFWKPGSAYHWSHSRATFPGPQQDVGALIWREFAPDARLAMGLGCYWGSRPGQGTTPYLSAPHTMRFAAVETAALGINEAWYWSLKWLIAGTDAGLKVRRFFGISV